MAWNQMIEGTRVVADDVKIEVHIEAESLLTPHELSPALIINSVEQNNGPHPGFRRVHAKGVCVAGYFESNGRGVALSKASVSFLAVCQSLDGFHYRTPCVAW